MILNGVKLLAKVGIAGGAGTIAADSFDLIDLSESTTVRSTRTALTTLSIIADYKKSLHNVSEEDYEAEQSKVSFLIYCEVKKCMQLFVKKILYFQFFAGTQKICK